MGTFAVCCASSSIWTEEHTFSTVKLRAIALNIKIIVIIRLPVGCPGRLFSGGGGDCCIWGWCWEWASHLRHFQCHFCGTEQAINWWPRVHRGKRMGARSKFQRYDVQMMATCSDQFVCVVCNKLASAYDPVSFPCYSSLHSLLFELRLLEPVGPFVG